MTEQFSSKLEQDIHLAYEVVKRSGIEEPDLMREAFKYALASFSEDVSRESRTSRGEKRSNPIEVDFLSPYKKIALAIDLPPDTIELLYDITGDTLALNLPSKALPYSASAAMREIAILLAVGRKHSGIGTGTPFELIRIACSEYGKLDKKNFAAAMNGTKPRVSITGKGAERELVPKRAADDSAKELLIRYAQSVR